jgi:hypothetical protein
LWGPTVRLPSGMGTNCELRALECNSSFSRRHAWIDGMGHRDVEIAIPPFLATRHERQNGTPDSGDTVRQTICVHPFGSLASVGKSIPPAIGFASRLFDRFAFVEDEEWRPWAEAILVQGDSVIKPMILFRSCQIRITT